MMGVAVIISTLMAGRDSPAGENEFCLGKGVQPGLSIFGDARALAFNFLALLSPAVFSFARFVR